MLNNPNETRPAENFVIENNIIKGAHRQFPDNFQIGKLLFDILSSKPDHVPQAFKITDPLVIQYYTAKKADDYWPNEIENILLRRDDILEAAVVSIPHEVDGERPIAFVKKNPDSNLTQEGLMKSLEILGENKQLHGGILFIDELPRLTGGKIIRKKLIEMARANIHKCDETRYV